MENRGRLLFTCEMKNGSPQIKKSKTSLQVSKDLLRVLVSLSAFIEARQGFFPLKAAKQLTCRLGNMDEFLSLYLWLYLQYSVKINTHIRDWVETFFKVLVAMVTCHVTVCG